MPHKGGNSLKRCFCFVSPCFTYLTDKISCAKDLLVVLARLHEPLELALRLRLLVDVVELALATHAHGLVLREALGAEILELTVGDWVLIDPGDGSPLTKHSRINTNTIP